MADRSNHAERLARCRAGKGSKRDYRKTFEVLDENIRYLHRRVSDLLHEADSRVADAKVEAVAAERLRKDRETRRLEPGEIKVFGDEEIGDVWERTGVIAAQPWNHLGDPEPVRRPTLPEPVLTRVRERERETRAIRRYRLDLEKRKARREDDERYGRPLFPIVEPDIPEEAVQQAMHELDPDSIPSPAEMREAIMADREEPKMMSVEQHEHELRKANIMPDGSRWKGLTKDKVIQTLERRLAEAHRRSQNTPTIKRQKDLIHKLNVMPRLLNLWIDQYINDEADTYGKLSAGARDVKEKLAELVGEDPNQSFTHRLASPDEGKAGIRRAASRRYH
jgi:hypothetical protein